MLPLIKFEYNSRLYCVELHNKKTRYYCVKNNIKNYNLTQEEKELVDYAVDSVTPSDDTIKLMDYKFKGNTYEIYLDKKTNMRLFKPTPSYNDAAILNGIFNNVEESVYAIDKDSNNPLAKEIMSYFKRSVRGIGIVFVSTLFAINIAAFIGLKDKSPQERKYLYNELLDAAFNTVYKDIAHTATLSDEEIESRITAAIARNKNLSGREKEDFLSYMDVLLDNKEYMSISHIESMLEGIYFEYIPEANGDIAGEYSPQKNCIKFYGVTGHKEVNEEHRSHEILHAFTLGYFSEKNTALIESLNAGYNKEYRGYEENYYYTIYLNYTHALIEIIGSEPVKKYRNYERLDYIIEPLNEIINDEDKAKRLLGLFEDLKRITEQIIIYNKLGIDYDEELENLNNIRSQIWQELGDYYKAKYGFDMKKDIFILYDLDKHGFKQAIIDFVASKGIEVDDTCKIESAECFSYFNERITCPNNIDIKIYRKGIPIYRDLISGINKVADYNQSDKYPYILAAIHDMLKAKMLGCSEKERQSQRYNYVRALEELLGAEVIKEACDCCDSNKIKEALCKIDGNENNAEELLNAINNYCKLAESPTSTEETESHEQALREIAKFIYYSFNKYCDAKYDAGCYNYEINEDLIMNYYLDEEGFVKIILPPLLEYYNVTSTTNGYYPYIIPERDFLSSFDIFESGKEKAETGLLVYLFDDDGHLVSLTPYTIDDSNRHEKDLGLRGSPISK